MKPTIKNITPLLEVHIFDFEKNIYSYRMNVEFINFIRAEKKFESLEKLKSQIIKDIKRPEMTDYSKTINLPDTKFSMKANLSQTETAWIDFGKKKITEKKNIITENSSKFILHDGPPYANGDLHLGHALNKILKDIVCRFRFQKGNAVHYIPGWDCHGLPIEWKVEEKFRKSGKTKEEVNLFEFREECRKFASKWVETQKSQFSRFGLSTDWKEIYLTMNESVEITIVSELISFLNQNNFI